MWGISWAGWEVAEAMIGAHPALKAASPQAPPQDQFMGDDYHSGGAVRARLRLRLDVRQCRAAGTLPRINRRTIQLRNAGRVRFFSAHGAAANAKQLFTATVPTWELFMAHGTYDEYWQSRKRSPKI